MFCVPPLDSDEFELIQPLVCNMWMAIFFQIKKIEKGWMRNGYQSAFPYSVFYFFKYEFSMWTFGFPVFHNFLIPNTFGKHHKIPIMRSLFIIHQFPHGLKAQI